MATSAEEAEGGGATTGYFNYIGALFQDTHETFTQKAEEYTNGVIRQAGMQRERGDKMELLRWVVAQVRDVQNRELTQIWRKWEAVLTALDKGTEDLVGELGHAKGEQGLKRVLNDCKATQKILRKNFRLKQPPEEQGQRGSSERGGAGAVGYAGQPRQPARVATGPKDQRSQEQEKKAQEAEAQKKTQGELQLERRKRPKKEPK
jgi:hypothetical protein